MTKFKLSIIIPIFGVEVFISQFLESLLPQINNHVQLIFIDDGCKDNSIFILKNYIDNIDKSNILVVSQENKGQSSARNYGISLSTGRFITFLDPDDLVRKNYIKKILESIDLCDPDLIHFNISTFLEDNKDIIKTHYLVEDSNLYLNNNDYMEKVFQKRLWFSCVRVIKRNFIDEDFFPIGYIYEDMFSFPRIYEKIKKIKNINDDLVLYRIHKKSSSRKIKPTLLYSAEFGLNYYQNRILYKSIYDSFLSLRVKNGIEILGFKDTFFWYYNNIYINTKSIYYKKQFIFFKYLFKLECIFLLKKILGR